MDPHLYANVALQGFMAFAGVPLNGTVTAIGREPCPWLGEVLSG